MLDLGHDVQMSMPNAPCEGDMSITEKPVFGGITLDYPSTLSRLSESSPFLLSSPSESSLLEVEGGDTGDATETYELGRDKGGSRTHIAHRTPENLLQTVLCQSYQAPLDMAHCLAVLRP